MQQLWSGMCRNHLMVLMWEEPRYWQLQENLLLTLTLASLRAVKGGFGDSQIITHCLTKFFMGRLVMQMRAAWPLFVRSWKRLLSDEGLSSQIYNADETGISWRSMPKNTQISRGEEHATGKKSSKEKLSLLVGSNATAEHWLKIAVVGKSKKPWAFVGLNIERDQPVISYHSRKLGSTPQFFPIGFQIILCQLCAFIKKCWRFLQTRYVQF